MEQERRGTRITTIQGVTEYKWLARVSKGLAGDPSRWDWSTAEEHAVELAVPGEPISPLFRPRSLCGLDVRQPPVNGRQPYNWGGSRENPNRCPACVAEAVRRELDVGTLFGTPRLPSTAQARRKGGRR